MTEIEQAAFEALEIGQPIYFMFDKLPYEIKARSKRYLICARPLHRRVDRALIQERVEMGSFRTFTEAYDYYTRNCVPIHTIVDSIRYCRTSYNMIFNSYNFNSEASSAQCIIDLMDGKIELSHRNKIDLLIDWTKTK